MSMFTEFDGQQEGEHILYVIHPHPLTAYIAYCSFGFMGLCIIFFAVLIGNVFSDSGFMITIVGVTLGLLIILLGSLWTKKRHDGSVTYITDRRLMRFEVVSPVFTAKRALFWNEVLKAKAYAKNIFWKNLNIGTLALETHMPQQGDIHIDSVYYYDNLANYIDKILYLFKNSPAEISALKPFIPKPKGLRN